MSFIQWEFFDVDDHIGCSSLKFIGLNLYSVIPIRKPLLTLSCKGHLDVLVLR